MVSDDVATASTDQSATTTIGDNAFSVISVPFAIIHDILLFRIFSHPPFTIREPED